MSDSPFAGLSYDLLCLIHDLAAFLDPADNSAVAYAEALVELGAQDDLFSRSEALQVAIRAEVKARGIPPRYQPSWDFVPGADTHLQ